MRSSGSSSDTLSAYGMVAVDAQGIHNSTGHGHSTYSTGNICMCVNVHHVDRSMTGMDGQGASDPCERPALLYGCGDLHCLHVKEGWKIP